MVDSSIVRERTSVVYIWKDVAGALTILGFEPELTNHIQEAFGHEQHYTDGTIFRNIRRYHLIADKANENKWWARLTTSKRRDLKQLFKDQRLLQAFDNLLEFPGIWPPVQLGTLHRQHGLRCSEV
jgi:hypothetical protein